MEFSEKVLVLQLGKFKEADMWVRFLSPTRGILSAFAFGGSRSRRRFVGCLDVFNEIQVRICGSSRTTYLALQEGVLLRGLERLRHDWGRFGLAVNCARFLQSFGVAPEGAEKAYLLMRQVLTLLEEQEAVPRLLPLYFRARMAFDQGYALETNSCAICGSIFSNTSSWLHLREGQICCAHCSGRMPGHTLALGPEARSALETVSLASPADWGGIGLPEYAARECARAIDGFVQFHVGISWRNGRFVRH